MKIVMLGHSGVGKTTFMASMYGQMQTPVNGFSLRAAGDAEHAELKSLADGIRAGRFPGPTAVRAEYRFFLEHNGRRCFDFTWADYRGGALQERSTSDEKARLVDELAKAQGILVFVDSQVAASPRGAGGEVGRMMGLLSNALPKISGHVPLALVFTKADLVDRFTDHMHRPVAGLCETVAASGQMKGAFIPVACGRSARHVEAPVLFLLWQGILSGAKTLLDSLNSSVGTAEGNLRGGKANPLKNAWEGWTSGSNDLSRAVSAAQWATTQYEKLEPLIEPARSLKQYLKWLHTF